MRKKELEREIVKEIVKEIAKEIAKERTRTSEPTVCVERKTFSDCYKIISPL
ncbi:MAG: hypothetical protein RR416_00190 [Clostridia bacterium]